MKSRKREKHTGKREEMNFGLEGKEMVWRKWGWSKRKIPGKDQKYKSGDSHKSKRRKPAVPACLVGGEEWLENPRRALRSGVSRA